MDPPELPAEEESSSDELGDEEEEDPVPEQVEGQAQEEHGDEAVDSIVLADDVADWVDTVLDDAAPRDPQELGALAAASLKTARKQKDYRSEVLFASLVDFYRWMPRMGRLRAALRVARYHGRGPAFQRVIAMQARFFRRLANLISKVGRMIEEGGIASDLQVASEIQAAKAFTLSGDGTTIRHLNFEAKHVTYFRPGENVPVTRMLDTTSARNHTSEEQLAGWQDTIQRSLVYTYNASPLGQENSIDNDEFVTFIKGIGADHAPDQKKWARLTADWVLVSHKIMAGKQYLSNTEMQSYMPEILRRNDQKIQDAGGINAWNALSEDEKTRRDIQVCRELYLYYGENDWKDLTPEEQLEKQFLVWCGCCMHKEMNSVKGGVQAMKLFCQTIGGPEPVKLMNKANAAAASNSAPGSQASEHANDVSDGGAVKVTSLLGALFNHKDDKKGQQDTFKLYFEEFLGYTVSCPDTSNTRFQCHCDCAIFIILYLAPILDFMMFIKYSKEKIALNHLEQNILKATSTCELRVNGVHPNALDLGPWHAKTIAFCESVANNVDLLLAPDASFKTGSLDGQPWEHPDVFYVIQKMAGGLPHLRACLKAFMTGAADTWKRFGEEYERMG
ncbi:hypothetical protein B0H14DRAFT_3486189 [Mycena olivaceomarginata]|nr:hypothetical protein B0H14DRAFT_3486189 [Mycena olivaceomarginata]